MGAVEFTIKSKGNTISEAYRDAVERCMDEEGDNPYNGTISTTDSYRDVTDKYKASKMPLDKFIARELESCGKRYCMAVELVSPVKNTSKVKSQVENIVIPGTKKWVLRYFVFDYDRNLASFEKKGDAIKYARAYTEKEQRTTNIEMRKVIDNKYAPCIVARVKYKPSSKERQGEWIFFGMAAC